MNPLVNCSVVAGTGLLTLLWLCLLIASLITRPKPSTTMRLLDQFLIIAFVLMAFRNHSHLSRHPHVHEQPFTKQAVIAILAVIVGAQRPT